MSRGRPAADPWRFLAAIVAGSAIVSAGLYTIPLQIGALMDGLALSETKAGLIGTAELLAIGLTALAVTPWLPRMRLRTPLIGLALGIAAAHLASAGAQSFAVLLVWRLLTGCLEGLALALVNAAYASSRDPDRLAGRVAILAGLLAAVLLIGLPGAIEEAAQRGAFFGLAVFVLLCLPLLLWFPERLSRAAAAASAGSLGLLRRHAGLLAGVVAFALSQSALWAFLERLGLAAGLEGSAVGGVLAASAIGGLAGAGLAAWLGSRISRCLPVSLGCAALALAAAALATWSSPPVFILGAIVYSLSFYVVLPYLVGAAASLDAGGRVVAAFGALATLAAGPGPALGGLLVAGFGLPGLGWGAALLTVFSLAAVLPILRRLDRQAASGVPA